MQLRPVGLWLAILILCCGSAGALDLKQDMRSDEFARAGLKKLSAEELDYLQQWLNRSRPEPVAATPIQPAGAPAIQSAPAKNQFVPLANPAREMIESRIRGKFSGWSGATLFRLENGQVWRQAERTSFSMQSDSPAVRIVPKAFGSWMLRIEGSNHSVRVVLVGHEEAQQ